MFDCFFKIDLGGSKVDTYLTTQWMDRRWAVHSLIQLAAFWGADSTAEGGDASQNRQITHPYTYEAADDAVHSEGASLREFIYNRGVHRPFIVCHLLGNHQLCYALFSISPFVP